MIRDSHPTSETRSGSLALLPVVIVDDTSKHFPSVYFAFGGKRLSCQWLWRHQHLLADTLVRSSSIVVFGILQEYSLQMSLAYD